MDKFILFYVSVEKLPRAAVRGRGGAVKAAVPNSITRQPFNCTQREEVRKTTPAPEPGWSQSGRKPNIRLFLGDFACLKWLGVPRYSEICYQ